MSDDDYEHLKDRCMNDPLWAARTITDYSGRLAIAEDMIVGVTQALDEYRGDEVFLDDAVRRLVANHYDLRAYVVHLEGIVANTPDDDAVMRMVVEAGHRLNEAKADLKAAADWLAETGYPLDWNTGDLPPEAMRALVEDAWIAKEGDDPESTPDDIRAIVAQEGGW